MAIQERDFERVINRARIQLPGASDAGIKSVLFDVIDEFFDATNAWAEWIALTLTPGNQVYQVYPQFGGMINRLVTAIDINNVTQPATLSLDGTSISNNTTVFSSPPGAILTFFQPVNTSTALQVLVAKKSILPNNKDDIPDAPSWLFPKYARYLLEGLVGTSMMERAKPYSDPNNASYHLKKFRDGMAMAKTEVMRGNIYGGQAWTYPRGFRSNSQRGGVSTPFPTPSGQGAF